VDSPSDVQRDKELLDDIPAARSTMSQRPAQIGGLGRANVGACASPFQGQSTSNEQRSAHKVDRFLKAKMVTDRIRE
jgi:hypothetical protein